MKTNFKREYFFNHTIIKMILLIFIIVISCTKKNEQYNHKGDAGFYYTCSMDPQVIESKPGKCPICKMELTKVKKVNFKEGTLELSNTQIKLANIKTDTLRFEEIGEDVILNGIISVNQNKVENINSRTDGRVEKLYFKNVGDVIKKGELIYEIYSEELISLQKEYTLAIKKQHLIKDSEIDYKNIVDALKNKLLLKGITENQITALEKQGDTKFTISVICKSSGVITKLNISEGEYLKEGEPIMQLADLSSIWVEAQVFSGEGSDIDNNSKVIVNIPGFPEKKISANVDFINPEINPQSKIGLIRVELENKNGELKPGMQATIVFRKNLKKAMAIQSNAIQTDSHGSTVWIQKGDHTFELKMVKTGISNGDKIEIKSGLQMGDKVVVTGAYLLGSEYIFKKGVNPMAGHKM